MDKYLVHRRMGLCNRLRALVSLWRLGQEFSLYEQKTLLFPGSFSDILTNKINYHPDPEGWVLTWRLIMNEGEIDPEFAKVRPAGKGIPSIDLEYNRIPQNIKDLFIPYFKQLSFKPEILEDVEKIYKELNLKDFTAVHIREDFDWKTSGRESPLERYYKEIDKHLEDRMYFIVHNKEILEQVKQKYGDRVVTLPNKSYQNRNPSDMIEWVKDLLILSKCKKMVAHGLSSFAETAWWLSGCKIEPYILPFKWNGKLC